MQALSAPQRLGAALACLGVLAAVPAAAQVYRCEEGGRIVYSDKPCPGSGRTVYVGPGRGENRAPAAKAAPRTPTAADELARRCADGTASACRIQKIVQQFDQQRAEREPALRRGERAACDLIDCVDKSDRAACTRAEGRSTDAGWTETGRRIEVRPGRSNEGTVPGDRVTIISVACDHGGAPVIEIGNAGVRVAGQSPRFESLDAAARHACGIDP
jgi:hypothetical protein